MSTVLRVGLTSAAGRCIRVSAIVVATGLLASTALQAQTAQSVSFQFSGLSNSLFGSSLESVKSGFGGEAQIRYTPSALSFGIGGQYTSHGVEGDADETVSLAGAFFEPRYVIFVGSETVAPYLSSRLSVSSITTNQSDGSATGFTANAGGGLLFRVGDRANLDLGATFGVKDLGELPTSDGSTDLGQGTNLIVRVGLAFGIAG